MTRATRKTPVAEKKPQQPTRGGAVRAPRKAAAAKPAAAKVAPKPAARAVRTTAKKAAPTKKATPAKRTTRPRTRKAVDTKPEVVSPGPVELKVRSDVGALVSAHPMGEALAAMSFALAKGIDSGPEMMRAALNRELRLNLVELAGMGVGSDDLGSSLSEPEGGETG